MFFAGLTGISVILVVLLLAHVAGRGLDALPLACAMSVLFALVITSRAGSDRAPRTR